MPERSRSPKEEPYAKQNSYRRPVIRLRLTVGQLMQELSLHVVPYTECLTVSRLMTQHHFGSLPVVDGISPPGDEVRIRSLRLMLPALPG